MHERVSRDWLGNLCLTLPFLLLYWLDLAHHTIFFDEINAWAIAAASPNLITLFHLVHYEGHPWLWYFLLWFPSRFTHDPSAMKWIVAPVGTAIYLVLGLLSPFTRLQKVLIFFSYFVIFEYTVMNRMYGIMFLLALLYVWRRMRKPDAVLGNVAFLALMANTDMTGFLLSAALLLEYIYDRWQAHRTTGWHKDDIRAPVLAAALYLSLVLVSIASLLPSADISWQSSGHIGAYAAHPKYLLRVFTNMVAAPWWPISPLFPHHFWETDAAWQKPLYLLAPFVLLAYWRIFRRDRNLQLVMALTLAFGTLFAALVYVGRVRHWGIAFVTFLLALWMQSATCSKSEQSRPYPWSPFAYTLLGVSALAGTIAIASSWTHPFSLAKAAGTWIKRNEAANVALVGEPDVSFASVAEEMERPVYFLECRCIDTFKLFSRQREDFPETEMGDRLSLAMDDLHTKSLVFVFYRPLDAKDTKCLKADSLSAVPLASFTGAESILESYYVYQITRNSSSR